MSVRGGLTRIWTEVQAAKPFGWELRGVVKGPCEVDPVIHPRTEWRLGEADL